MAGNPENEDDMDALARRYMDLWQKQLAALSDDAAVADMMAKTLELMNAGAMSFDAQTMMDPKTNPFLAAFSTAPGTKTHAGTKDGTQDGTKAAAPSGGDPDHDVAQLARRVRALEKRIAELEGGPAKRSKRAQPKSKKR